MSVSKARFDLRLVLLAAMAALPLAALAQKPVTKTEAEEMTSTIEAIDQTARLVTLKDKDGVLETLYVPPELKRFGELKVGDKVTFRYYQSHAYQIRKAGQPAPAPASEQLKAVPGGGPRPGGTISQQKTSTVTVKSVDMKAPSVTVLTEDGRTLSIRVDDKKNLEGLKAGDKIDITYTEAVMISVK